MPLIDWLLYRRNGSPRLKSLENQLNVLFHRSSFDVDTLSEILIELFDRLHGDWYYTGYVLKKIFSRRASNVSLVSESICRAYFKEDWLERFSFGFRDKWSKSPWGVADYIMIFAMKNDECLSNNHFFKVLVNLAEKHILDRYMNWRTQKFILVALKAIDSAKTIERRYYGDRPYWNVLASLLYSKSKEVIKAALSLLMKMPIDRIMDPNVFVQYLSWPDLREYTGVEKLVRGHIVSMGPQAVYSLDPEIGRVRVLRNDEWFQKQIALTAAEMTIHFEGQDPLEVTIFEPWILRHRKLYVDGKIGDVNATRMSLLFDVIAKSLGIDKALSRMAYSSLKRLESLKAEFQKSSILTEILDTLSSTKSPILEGILSEYLSWTLGTFLEAIRTKYTLTPEGMNRTGLFPYPDKHAEIVRSLLAKTPKWDTILKYLLTLGNELGLTIALDLIDDGLILEYPDVMAREPKLVETEYSKSLLKYIVNMLRTSERVDLVIDLLRNKPYLLNDSRVKGAVESRGKVLPQINSQ